MILVTGLSLIAGNDKDLLQRIGEILDKSATMITNDLTMSRNNLIINQILTPPSQCRNIRERPLLSPTEKSERSLLFGDLGKNVLTVALASYFFEKFPLPVRISICIIGVILLILGFLMQPSEKGV